ncbi:hypothetical protein EOI86_06715 [Hwanghaeella grinnelliae]|uniref:Uncharacterized protein n=1 Tax=Hwanghaeella grinnelliae TaxID=2500179 RepID=A0A3S2Y5D9_9PROT|nr:hypothetical protein [Hwanghaeella grinnelliae]RVU38951.1 hypothetical protein EOI86_06715 [Hwanghaeella grinnelliae]
MDAYQHSGNVPILSSADGWHDYLSGFALLALGDPLNISGFSKVEKRYSATIRAAILEKRSLAAGTAFFEMLAGEMYDDTLAPKARALLRKALPDLSTIAAEANSPRKVVFDAFLKFVSRGSDTGPPDHRDLRDLIDATEEYPDPYLDSVLASLLANLPDDAFRYINLGDGMEALRAGLYAGDPHNLILFYKKGFNSDLAKAVGLRFDYMYWKTLGEIVNDPSSLLLQADRKGYAHREEHVGGQSRGMYDWCFQNHVEDSVTCTATAFYQHFPCLPLGRDGLRVNVTGTRFYNACRTNIHDGMQRRLQRLRQGVH